MPFAAIPAAVWASSAIGAGTSLASGLMGSRAAGKAADQQQQAANAALGLQRQQWQQSLQNLAPYRGIGEGAAAQLSKMLGYGPAAPQTYATAPQTTAAPTLSGLGPLVRQLSRAVVSQVPGITPTASAPAAGSSTVTLRAPNGATMRVPSQYVDHYMQRGAQVVSNG
jgi:type II secretory pathway pseudopilin PulG